MGDQPHGNPNLLRNNPMGQSNPNPSYLPGQQNSNAQGFRQQMQQVSNRPNSPFQPGISQQMGNPYPPRSNQRPYYQNPTSLPQGMSSQQQSSSQFPGNPMQPRPHTVSPFGSQSGQVSQSVAMPNLGSNQSASTYQNVSRMNSAQSGTSQQPSNVYPQVQQQESYQPSGSVSQSQFPTMPSQQQSHQFKQTGESSTRASKVENQSLHHSTPPVFSQPSSSNTSATYFGSQDSIRGQATSREHPFLGQSRPEAGPGFQATDEKNIGSSNLSLGSSSSSIAPESSLTKEEQPMFAKPGMHAPEGVLRHPAVSRLQRRGVSQKSSPSKPTIRDSEPMIIDSESDIRDSESRIGDSEPIINDFVNESSQPNNGELQKKKQNGPEAEFARFVVGSQYDDWFAKDTSDRSDNADNQLLATPENNAASNEQSPKQQVLLNLSPAFKEAYKNASSEQEKQDGLQRMQFNDRNAKISYLQKIPWRMMPIRPLQRVFPRVWHPPFVVSANWTVFHQATLRVLMNEWHAPMKWPPVHKFFSTEQNISLPDNANVKALYNALEYPFFYSNELSESQKNVGTEKVTLATESGALPILSEKESKKNSFTTTNKETKALLDELEAVIGNVDSMTEPSLVPFPNMKNVGWMKKRVVLTERREILPSTNLTNNPLFKMSTNLSKLNNERAMWLSTEYRVSQIRQSQEKNIVEKNNEQMVELLKTKGAGIDTVIRSDAGNALKFIESRQHTTTGKYAEMKHKLFQFCLDYGFEFMENAKKLEEFSITMGTFALELQLEEQRVVYAKLRWAEKATLPALNIAKFINKERWNEVYKAMMRLMCIVPVSIADSEKKIFLIALRQLEQELSSYLHRTPWRSHVFAINDMLLRTDTTPFAIMMPNPICEAGIEVTQLSSYEKFENADNLAYLRVQLYSDDMPSSTAEGLADEKEDFLIDTPNPKVKGRFALKLLKPIPLRPGTLKQLEQSCDDVIFKEVNVNAHEVLSRMAHSIKYPTSFVSDKSKTATFNFEFNDASMHDNDDSVVSGVYLHLYTQVISTMYILKREYILNKLVQSMSETNPSSLEYKDTLNSLKKRSVNFRVGEVHDGTITVYFKYCCLLASIKIKISNVGSVDIEYIKIVHHSVKMDGYMSTADYEDLINTLNVDGNRVNLVPDLILKLNEILKCYWNIPTLIDALLTVISMGCSRMHFAEQHEFRPMPLRKKPHFFDFERGNAFESPSKLRRFKVASSDKIQSVHQAGSKNFKRCSSGKSTFAKTSNLGHQSRVQQKRMKQFLNSHIFQVLTTYNHTKICPSLLARYSYEFGNFDPSAKFSKRVAPVIIPQSRRRHFHRYHRNRRVENAKAVRAKKNIIYGAAWRSFMFSYTGPCTIRQSTMFTWPSLSDQRVEYEVNGINRRNNSEDEANRFEEVDEFYNLSDEEAENRLIPSATSQQSIATALKLKDYRNPTTFDDIIGTFNEDIHHFTVRPRGLTPESNELKRIRWNISCLSGKYLQPRLKHRTLRAVIQKYAKTFPMPVDTKKEILKISSQMMNAAIERKIDQRNNALEDGSAKKQTTNVLDNVSSDGKSVNTISAERKLLEESFAAKNLQSAEKTSLEKAPGVKDASKHSAEKKIVKSSSTTNPLEKSLSERSAGVQSSLKTVPATKSDAEKAPTEKHSGEPNVAESAIKDSASVIKNSATLTRREKRKIVKHATEKVMSTRMKEFMAQQKSGVASMIQNERRAEMLRRPTAFRIINLLNRPEPVCWGLFPYDALRHAVQRLRDGFPTEESVNPNRMPVPIEPMVPKEIHLRLAHNFYENTERDAYVPDYDLNPDKCREKVLKIWKYFYPYYKTEQDVDRMLTKYNPDAIYRQLLKLSDSLYMERKAEEEEAEKEKLEAQRRKEQRQKYIDQQNAQALLRQSGVLASPHHSNSPSGPQFPVSTNQNMVNPMMGTPFDGFSSTLSQDMFGESSSSSAMSTPTSTGLSSPFGAKNRRGRGRKTNVGDRQMIPPDVPKQKRGRPRKNPLSQSPVPGSQPQMMPTSQSQQAYDPQTMQGLQFQNQPMPYGSPGQMQQLQQQQQQQFSPQHQKSVATTPRDSPDSRMMQRVYQQYVESSSDEETDPPPPRLPFKFNADGTRVYEEPMEETSSRFSLPIMRNPPTQTPPSMIPTTARPLPKLTMPSFHELPVSTFSKMAQPPITTTSVPTAPTSFTAMSRLPSTSFSMVPPVAKATPPVTSTMESSSKVSRSQPSTILSAQIRETGANLKPASSLLDPLKKEALSSSKLEKKFKDAEKLRSTSSGFQKKDEKSDVIFLEKKIFKESKEKDPKKEVVGDTPRDKIRMKVNFNLKTVLEPPTVQTVDPSKSEELAKKERKKRKEKVGDKSFDAVTSEKSSKPEKLEKFDKTEKASKSVKFDRSDREGSTKSASGDVGKLPKLDKVEKSGKDVKPKEKKKFKRIIMSDSSSDEEMDPPVQKKQISSVASTSTSSFKSTPTPTSMQKKASEPGPSVSTASMDPSQKSSKKVRRMKSPAPVLPRKEKKRDPERRAEPESTRLKELEAHSEERIRRQKKKEEAARLNKSKDVGHDADEAANRMRIERKELRLLESIKSDKTKPLDKDETERLKYLRQKYPRTMSPAVGSTSFKTPVLPGQPTSSSPTKKRRTVLKGASEGDDRDPAYTSMPNKLSKPIVPPLRGTAANTPSAEMKARLLKVKEAQQKAKDAEIAKLKLAQQNARKRPLPPATLTNMPAPPPPKKEKLSTTVQERKPIMAQFVPEAGYIIDIPVNFIEQLFSLHESMKDPSKNITQDMIYRAKLECAAHASKPHDSLMDILDDLKRVKASIEAVHVKTKSSSLRMGYAGNQDLQKQKLIQQQQQQQMQQQLQDQHFAPAMRNKPGLMEREHSNERKKASHEVKDSDGDAAGESSRLKDEDQKRKETLTDEAKMMSYCGSSQIVQAFKGFKIPKVQPVEKPNPVEEKEKEKEAERDKDREEQRDEKDRDDDDRGERDRDRRYDSMHNRRYSADFNTDRRYDNDPRRFNERYDDRSKYDEYGGGAHEYHRDEYANRGGYHYHERRGNTAPGPYHSNRRHNNRSPRGDSYDRSRGHYHGRGRGNYRGRGNNTNYRDERQSRDHWKNAGPSGSGSMAHEEYYEGLPPKQQQLNREALDDSARHPVFDNPNLSLQSGVFQPPARKVLLPNRVGDSMRGSVHGWNHPPHGQAPPQPPPTHPYYNNAPPPPSNQVPPSSIHPHHAAVPPSAYSSYHNQPPPPPMVVTERRLNADPRRKSTRESRESPPEVGLQIDESD